MPSSASVPPVNETDSALFHKTKIFVASGLDENPRSFPARADKLAHYVELRISDVQQLSVQT